MAIETITHTCGHTTRENLVGPMAGRTARAEWLASQPCIECKRAAEVEAATAATAGMVDLIGSDKQVAWAMTIRAAAVAAVDALLAGAALNAQQQAAIDALRGQADAKFWIDNRVNGDVAIGWLRLASKLAPAK